MISKTPMAATILRAQRGPQPSLASIFQVLSAAIASPPGAALPFTPQPIRRTTPDQHHQVGKGSLIWEWPRISITTLAGTPWASRTLAAVWRRSCNRTWRRPARAMIARNKARYRAPRACHPGLCALCLAARSPGPAAGAHDEVVAGTPGEQFVTTPTMSMAGCPATGMARSAGAGGCGGGHPSAWIVFTLPCTSRAPCGRRFAIDLRPTLDLATCVKCWAPMRGGHPSPG